MQNELTTRTFDFKGKEVTTIIDSGGSPWWVANEICGVLGVEAKHSVTSLDDDEKTKVDRTDLGYSPGQPMWVINESGLYSIVLKSRKPEAKRFKKWVTGEVLPSIRKTGSYSSQLEIPKTYPAALRALATEFEKRIDAEKIVADQKPKIEEYNTFLNTEGLYSLTEAGKLVTGKPNKFTALLRDKKVLYLRNGVNLPRQRYLNAGYFEVRAMRPNASSFTQTFVTPRGLPALLRICNPGTQVALF